MKLDLNFTALTKLKDWWVQVQNNFRTIETECTATRTLAENACTPEQAQEYLAELVGSNAEYMAAITAFKDLYESSGNSTEALETLFGERVSLTEYNTHKNNTEIHHTHVNKAILDEITTDKVEKWDSKSEVVFGTYTGDGSTSRFINLGFTPVAVEVYTDTGRQGGASGGLNNCYYGGLALNGYPCRDVIEVVENGFNVFHDSKNSRLSNNQGTVYYFKAYKNGTIQEV